MSDRRIEILEERLEAAEDLIRLMALCDARRQWSMVNPEVEAEHEKAHERWVKLASVECSGGTIVEHFKRDRGRKVRGL